MNLLKEIESIRASETKAVLCIIVQTKGSTPRKVGAKMIVKEDGSILGTIGGGNLEKKVIENALVQIEKNEPKLYKHDLYTSITCVVEAVLKFTLNPFLK